MSHFNTITISLHVVAGIAALITGAFALLLNQQPTKHKRFGRLFLRLLSVVVATGGIGLLFFRNNSFLLLLTLLSGYVGYAGYRTILLRQQRSSTLDVLIAAGVLTIGGLYVFWLKQSDQNWAPAVVDSTLSALVLVTTYDLLKHFWLHERIKTWWIYEHIYKMVSAYSAILAAFVGTVLPNYKPYSQIGPSIVCLWLIGFFIWRQQRRNRPAHSM